MKCGLYAIESNGNNKKFSYNENDAESIIFFLQNPPNNDILNYMISIFI